MIIKAFKMRLEYGMREEYERQHAAIWPDVERIIHEYGGRDCSLFLDERSGTVFGCIKVEDEERWAQIVKNEIFQKWLDNISGTVKMDRENIPAVTTLRMVTHIE